MKAVFMGTPDFAVPALEALVKAGHEVIGVVTQPDKPKGRGKKISFPPVKEKALEYDIPVYQPLRVKEESFINKLRELSPEVIVVAAFGQILPKAVLDLPKYGCINIHASLLPKYRGAAPIQWAVINGEKESGVTTMYMDIGLDTGDILLQKAITLEPDETGGSLFDKLSKAGPDLLLSTLQRLEDGTIVRIKQDDEKSNYAGMLNKSLGKIDFNKSCIEIERFIRGLNPWPSAYTYYEGKILKIWKAQAIETKTIGKPGEIIGVEEDAVIVQTKDGVLRITELQPEGKKRMETAAFLRGYPVQIGLVLG